MDKLDAVVIGLGAMGSASLYQLAKGGVKALGIDQFEPPHAYGSSHGETRITRQAIAEGQEYVPLVTRANELWRQIEAETGRGLFTQTGILIMASGVTGKSNKFVDNTIAAAQACGIRHRELNAGDIKSQFPQFNVRGDEVGYYEDDAGFLHAELCIGAQLDLAKKYGARLRTQEKFLSYEQRLDGIVVTTDKAQYLADKLVLTVGPWVQRVLPEAYKQSIQIYRQVLYWFELQDDANNYTVGKFPVFNWEFNSAHEDFIYGFPSLDGRTIKIATEQYDSATDPERASRQVTSQETQAMYEQYVAAYLPGVSSRCRRAEVCLYSFAPDWRFLIDYHPDNRNVIIASPCSGHGFKHSAAIGEIISDLIQSRPARLDISEFGFDKLGRY